MFEKEADYIKAKKENKDKITKVISAWSVKEETIYDVGFQEGAEFGYNKALDRIDELKAQVAVLTEENRVLKAHLRR